MFGISFFEIILLLIIALIVLGPQRLPEVIKVTVLCFTRLKRKWNDIRHEVEKEIGADDIKQALHNERVLHELKKAGYDDQGNPPEPKEPSSSEKQ